MKTTHPPDYGGEQSDVDERHKKGWPASTLSCRGTGGEDYLQPKRHVVHQVVKEGSRLQVSPVDLNLFLLFLVAKQ